MAFAASVRSNTAQVPYSFVKEQPQSETALEKNRAGHPPQEDGGGERTRTDDLLRARQALSQLSYTPERQISNCPIRRPIGRSVALPTLLPPPSKY